MGSGKQNWEIYYSKHKNIYNYYTFQEQMIELIQSKLKSLKGKKILEAGCGKGYESLQLSKLNADIVAVDYSKEAIKLLSKQVKKQKSNLKICQADIRNLPFKDKHFDLVFSQGVLEHFKNPDEVLKEQYRVLKHNGLIIIEVPNKYNLYTIYKHLLMYVNKWGAGWEREYTYKSLKELIEVNGFKFIDCVGRDFFILKIMRRIGKSLKIKEKKESKWKKNIRRRFQRNKFMLHFFLSITIVGKKK